MKATHYGTCQVCGCRQKLPGGRLSLHGYTTRWGFFSGVCVGARGLPFEQSIDLIEGMITRAKAEAASLRRQAVEDRQDASEQNCWVNAHFSVNARHGSGRRWIKTQLTVDKYGRTAYNHPGDSRPARIQQLGYYGTLESIVAQLTDAYGRHLESQAAKRDEYVAWQESRIKDWEPSAITPIGSQENTLGQLVATVAIRPQD